MNKRDNHQEMKESKKIMLTLFMFILVLVISSALSIFAQVSSPQLPHLFYGTSKVNGADTPIGTVIIAKVNGAEKGRITTEESGKYGGKPANEDKLLVQGGIADNAIIEFFISKVKAAQTASFDSGEIDELNLTWQFPDEISFEGNIANEPILCVPGTDIEITNGGLTIVINCDESAAATLNNISNLGTSFLIGAPVPGGVLNISNVYEISVTGDVEIIVTISYNDAGIDESTVVPYRFEGGVWTARPDLLISRDTTANTITFRVPPGGTPYTAFGSAPVPPAPTGAAAAAGGGGGGGGGCTYDWQCTSWSACQPNGKQTRSCTNRGTCADNLGKPSEVQDCTYTAPEAEEEEEAPTVTAPTAPTTPAVTPTAPTAPTGFAALTGAVISGLTTPGGLITALIVLVLVGATGYGGYYYLYKKK